MRVRVRVRVSETEGEGERGRPEREREGVRVREKVKVNSPASVPAWKHRRYSEQGKGGFLEGFQKDKGVQSASQPLIRLPTPSPTFLLHFLHDGSTLLRERLVLLVAQPR